jgi:hypothetical protein
MNVQERHATCIHEAAHATIARLMGLDVLACTVFDRPEISRNLERPGVTLGRTKIENPVSLVRDHPDDDVRLGAIAAKIISLLAGPAGSRAVGSDSGLALDYRLIFEDLGSAYDSEFFTNAIQAADFAFDVAKLERLTNQLVADHWPSIKAVASHLMEHGQISRTEIDRLIGV